ncbi:MAG: Tetratricopeptide 2 repeat protein [Verrucomicrobiales bacterium]|nr:Tetratricopeptide 2 repeat protein [Verrucomicrobiales bacterium]
MAKAPTTAPTNDNKTVLYICAFLALSTLAVYWPITHHDFVNFDDFDFVTENAHVQAGLTWDSIKWAFSLHTEVARNWHPLTMLTHMLDCQLFGLKAGMHHLVTLLYHVANTLLLFGVLRKMTGAMWRSAIVAMLFALHPLHVESVAWTAERKDVLSTMFWLLVMWMYVDYARTGSKTKYVLTFIFLALGLMSKPMLVTIPFVLLLMDYWPLRRFSFAARGPVANSKLKTQTVAVPSVQWMRLVMEKIPFFILSLLLCVITFNIQKTGGAMQMTDSLSLGARVSNALVSYAKYIVKMFWPDNLAGLYLRHGEWPIGAVAGAVVLLVAVTIAAIILAKRKPYFTFGWFYFVGTLVPVIGVIQVGMQAMADRFTYVPMTGLFIALVWGIADISKSYSLPKPALAGAVIAAFVACVITTSHIIPFWKNSETLFTRMIAIDQNNILAHYNLGNFYSRRGDKQRAMGEYEAALKAEPNYVEAHNNLAGILQEQHRHDEAIAHYKDAVRLSPDKTYVVNLGNGYVNAGRYSDAIATYDEASRQNPKAADARTNAALTHVAWANQLANSNHLAEAESHYRAALEINSSNADAIASLGLCLAREGKTQEAGLRLIEANRLRGETKFSTNPELLAELTVGNYFSSANKLEEAIPHYTAAARLDPDNTEAHNGLGICYAMLGKMDEAAKQFSEILRLQPNESGAHMNLANALAAQKKIDEAIPHYMAAIKGNPSDSQAHFNLALSMTQVGRKAEAIDEYKKALSLNPNYSEAKRALSALEQP